MKRFFAIIMAAVMMFTLAACGGNSSETTTAAGGTTAAGETTTAPGEALTFKIGLCNYVDDASLNQIIANIKERLETLGNENNVTFEIIEQNCQTDSTVLNQIIADFIADDVDLMIGVATPVAMAMQAATEDNQIPVVFSAVSDPEAAELVASNEEPGANITGTSDFLDTTAIMNLMFEADPDITSVGLLYDVGQDSSTTAIASAKAYLEDKGIEVVEATGTSVDEIMLAAESLVTSGVDAVFTPSDNTVMEAELSIYEIFAEAKIPHYTGADSFALNGAFLGYGVDYANLGVETAEMVYDILVNGENIATMPVRTFDNGIATINTETCAAIGWDYDEIAALFAPMCTEVKSIVTAEEFED